MKTLSLAVGLLLLTAYYCTAMPRAVNEAAPAKCCFKFFTGRIPQSHIISITKTHGSCREKGFVVSTARGKEICVGQNVNWAKKIFKEEHIIKNN